MGVFNGRSIKTKNLNHIKLRKELSLIYNNKYACTNCYNTPEIKELDCENQKMILLCPEHGRKNIEIKTYFKQMKYILKQPCEKCNKKNNIIFDSQERKYFCKKCIN